MEIFEEYQNPIDYVFVPLEGGELASGISAIFKQLSPRTKIIGVKIQHNSPLEILSQKNEHNGTYAIT